MEQKLSQLIMDCGATGAAVIDQSKIVLNPVFRDICAGNQCGNYGKCWMCPPDNGEVEELMNTIRSFPKAVLYQTIHEIEDSFDFEGMTEASHKHRLMSAEIHERLRGMMTARYLHLTCGGCHVCKTCAKVTNEPCRFPEKAMSSVEGYCMDVYNTTRSTPLRYTNGPNTVTYFGMVLFEE